MSVFIQLLASPREIIIKGIRNFACLCFLLDGMKWLTISFKDIKNYNMSSSAGIGYCAASRMNTAAYKHNV